MAATGQNWAKSGPLWTATGIKRGIGAVLDTSGIQRIGCLHFLYTHLALLRHPEVAGQVVDWLTAD